MVFTQIHLVYEMIPFLDQVFFMVTLYMDYCNGIVPKDICKVQQLWAELRMSATQIAMVIHEFPG